MGDYSTPTVTLDYFKILLLLGGIILLAHFAIRRMRPGLALWRQTGAGPLQVIARYPLEPKRTLYVMKAGTSVFLLGSSESGVQYLTALAAADFEIPQETGRTPVPPCMAFQDVLKRSLPWRTH